MQSVNRMPMRVRSQVNCVMNPAVDAPTGEGLRLHALDFVAQQSRGRIWQQQRFVLRNGREENAPWWGRQQPAERQCLWGATAFGDNVEDEWFIVWLLLQLTELHPGTIARQAEVHVALDMPRPGG
jgi:SGT1 protein